MGKINSRDKGARGERLFAALLREHGYEAERGCQHAGGKDSPDVKTNMPNVHWEIKFVEKLNLHSAMEQSKRDAGEDEMPIVAHKRSREEWLITMPFDSWIKLFKAYEEGQTSSLLKCAVAIRDFLADKDSSSTRYWDEEGNEIMHTDIGYFDEGLEELIEYLQQKGQNNGNR